MRIPTLAALSLLLFSGCSVLPTTPEDMRRNQSDVTKVCTQLDPDEAAERIRAGWRGCHFLGPSQGGTQAIVAGKLPILVPTSGGPGDYIRVERHGGSIIVVKGNIDDPVARKPAIQLLADIESTPSCKAFVTARGANFICSKAAAEVSDYLENPNQGCKR